ncbi:NADH dehydrogenase subunit [Haloplanus rallus]|uniref:NADH dehydrogenase subunit n=1 Tax=Haloplanus rallus TaxID=1816183 RepID=A0A6B9F3S0_9EURY|nr:NADH dehydrogenase subunit [Haloplanus rallus]QGX95076.1 NADH dehydrogenase subunit [Haloplanus rallus]
MSLSRLDGVTVPEIATTIRNAGVAGAGGSGFPTYAKWRRLDDVDHLLVNAQESEPVYHMDTWLGRERASGLAALFDALLGTALETVVVAPKLTDRDRLRPLETATDATVYLPDDLPLDPEAASGVVFAYTEDRYQYGMEQVLLRTVDGTVLVGDDLPMDHGWIVQNVETLANLRRALDSGTPVTRKYVHVAGDVPRHRFLDVPVGTPAAHLLDAAGIPIDAVPDDRVLLEGGPGWCFRTDGPPETFAVSKRTNGVLLVDRETVAAHTLGEGRIDLLDARDWDGDHEATPSALDPDAVRVPLVANPSLGPVAAADPIVAPGDRVERGEMIATPGEAISNAHHATLDGTVTAVEARHVTIRAGAADDRSRD